MADPSGRGEAGAWIGAVTRDGAEEFLADPRAEVLRRVAGRA